MTVVAQNRELTLEFLQEQLKAERLMTKSLESELKAEKMKTQGMQMLFDCMQELHGENRHLKSILKQRNRTLSKLKKFLQINPNNVSQFNWDEFSDSSELEEFTERGIPSVDSRQENEEHLSQNLESLSRSLNRNSTSAEQLQKRVEQLTNANDQLTAQLKSSGSEKDAEILTLRAQLCDAERSHKVNGILCDTLSEETIALKRHLLGTAEMCQKLMKTLEMKQSFIKKITNFRPSVDKLNGADIAMLPPQQQYGNLETQLKEVVTMNSRWQQYNEQRDEYVQQLVQRNAELEQAVINRKQQLSLVQQENIDQILIHHRQKLEIATEEASALKKENQSLKSRLEQMQGERNEVIQTLREQYAQDITKYKNAIQLHIENIETLKLQLQTYREDFESERRDRERAQDHIVQLKAQILSATQQLSLSQTSPHAEQIRTPDPHLHAQLSFSPEASLVGRGVVSFVPERSDSGELDLRPSD